MAVRFQVPDARSLQRLLNRLGWRGMSAFLLSLCGLLLLVLGILSLWHGASARPVNLRITSGADVEVREKLVQFLILKAADGEVALREIRTHGSLDALRSVENGDADLALVQAGIHLESDSPVRQVAAIDLERLHLLVRAEDLEALSTNLKSLRGKTVFMNYARSGTYLLGMLVLARLGLNARSPDSVRISNLTAQDIYSLLDNLKGAGESKRARLRGQLPDACFLVASLPSRLAWRLINEADYRLVPLPFAQALAMISIEEAVADSDHIDQLHIQPTDIPAYTYGLSPAVPATACPTLGVRTLLVAHKDVPVEGVQRLLPFLYEGTIPSLYRPPDPADMVPEYRLHDGTIRYRDRNKPIVRSEVIDVFRNVFAFVGPVLGLVLTLYGYYRWRQLLRFTKYFRQVIHLDLVVKGIRYDPHVPTNKHERYRYLESRLSQLQKQAIHDFCDNYFRGESIVFILTALLAETGQALRAEAGSDLADDSAPPLPAS